MAGRRQKVSHGREAYFIVAILLVVAFGFVSIWGPGGWVEMKRLEAELNLRKTHVDALQRGIQDKVKRIEELKSNSDALERYAREKGYSRPDEIIQHLPTETPPEK